MIPAASVSPSWSKHCIFAVTTFMQSRSSGVQRNHNIVSIDAKLHRIGSSGLLKPTEVIYLLQAE